MLWLRIFLCTILISTAQAEPLRVLMIDAGNPITPKGMNISLPRLVNQKHNHSDAMYQFITNGTPCLNVIIDWCVYHNGKDYDGLAYMHCLSKINNYDIVNMSLAGEGKNEYEEVMITTSTRPIIVAAAGNDGVAHHISRPAIYMHTKKSVLAISAINRYGIRLASSNWDKKSIDFLGEACYKNRINKTACIQGTSIATAMYTNKLIKELCPSRQKIGDKVR
jgi:Subtilase family